ncbi:1-deoxy-D-xylulose 5-phosphate reductoisomerase [bioreactor metagenome]|uniref:1-deoxy-D-xylulose-5-phosphate reductoisomerase n=1 Tax=bioreactor metagenome TaxID=1076179 RepID=A0A644T187_9ZZZZ|nr:1-deoxy-D-xylulose-5-phosphate reductoisomerase [Negativicutes bacterium]
MKEIAILGSTGSIGTQALDVIAAHSDKFRVVALAAYENDGLLEQQIKQFNPQIAVLVNKDAANRLTSRYRGNTLILAGEEGLIEAATHKKASIVLTSMVGFAGLKPTLAAIEAGKDIALANKETLVAAGSLVTARAKANQVRILPVDSEHSAILQCLCGENRRNIKRIILTASGGPFRGFTKEQLSCVTVSDCLRHPNWAMGQKITVDSATMANKGLEVIEARWLFNVDYDKIDVVIHPQSIIHSMVEFTDGAIMAQLGKPDMRIPIQYALAYPERIASKMTGLDFQQVTSLTFEQPNHGVFPALDMAITAGKNAGTMPCVFNAANEEAVYAFLKGKIKFEDITDIIKHVMDRHVFISEPDVDQISQADLWARSLAAEVMN